ncbi:MAG: T9SS type A sorting domain-containing protein, partial [Flavobacteriales bacterium]
ALLVYPNPANDRIRVQSKLQMAHGVTVEVLSVTGQVVVTQTLGDVAGGRIINLDVAHLPQGAYTVRFMSDEYSATESVVITR